MSLVQNREQFDPRVTAVFSYYHSLHESTWGLGNLRSVHVLKALFSISLCLVCFYLFNWRGKSIFSPSICVRTRSYHRIQIKTSSRSTAQVDLFKTETFIRGWCILSIKRFSYDYWKALSVLAMQNLKKFSKYRGVLKIQSSGGSTVSCFYGEPGDWWSWGMCGDKYSAEMHTGDSSSIHDRMNKHCPLSCCNYCLWASSWSNWSFHVLLEPLGQTVNCIFTFMITSDGWYAQHVHVPPFNGQLCLGIQPCRCFICTRVFRMCWSKLQQYLLETYERVLVKVWQ